MLDQGKWKITQDQDEFINIPVCTRDVGFNVLAHQLEAPLIA